MGRGQTAEVGSERISQNGYHYTKTEDRGWMLTHHLTAEGKLGRQLRDDELVKFVEPKFKRDPKNPAGVKVIRKKTATLRRRKAVIEDKIRELQAELIDINKRLENM
jgi:hypothetical protein